MNKKGFTLVELLAVVVILGLITTIVATKGFGVFDNAKNKIEEQNTVAIKEAAKLFMIDVQECDDDLDSDFIENVRNNIFNGNTNIDSCQKIIVQFNSEQEIPLSYLKDNNYITGSTFDDYKPEELDNVVVDVKIDSTTNKIVLDFDSKQFGSVINTYYVDADRGNDNNRGSNINPLKTMEKAIQLLNGKNDKKIILKSNVTLNGYYNLDDITIEKNSNQLNQCIYVSTTGNNSSSGTSTNPMKTIEVAVAKFNSQVSTKNLYLNSNFTVNGKLEMNGATLNKNGKTITQNIYVSENGSNSNNGKSATPMKTIEVAVTKFNSQVTNKNVYLNSNITINSSVNMSQIKLIGNSDTRTITNGQYITNLSMGSNLNVKYEYLYTGSSNHLFALPGKYVLEVWGAQGGFRSNVSYAGKGGYAKGTLNMSSAGRLYIYVGGAGNTNPGNATIKKGGFNGGGYRYQYNGGGGATDIRIGSSSLYARVIVAGGGGSDGAETKNGMYGGGTSGGTSIQYWGSYGFGGTQTGHTAHLSISLPTSQPITNNNSNYPGGFGFGGFGIYRSSGYGGAGGGGWYGGCGVYPDTSSDDDRGGGGGSGYVYTSSTYSSYPSGCRLNSSHFLTYTTLYAGNEDFIAPNGVIETGHPGNGYARITRVFD